MSKDTLRLMMGVQAILDAQKVPQHGRMAWDGRQMLGDRDVESGADSALLDSIVFGTGMWNQGFARAIHIGASMLYKPQTPDEVDAYVESLIADDIDTHLRGAWRLSRLATALRAAYP